MNYEKMDGNDIKHYLRDKKGMDLKTFAQKHEFTYRTVSDVVRGVNQGKYGEGRKVLEKIKELITVDDSALTSLNTGETHERN